MHDDSTTVKTTPRTGVGARHLERAMQCATDNACTRSSSSRASRSAGYAWLQWHISQPAVNNVALRVALVCSRSVSTTLSSPKIRLLTVTSFDAQPPGTHLQPRTHSIPNPISHCNVRSKPGMARWGTLILPRSKPACAYAGGEQATDRIHFSTALPSLRVANMHAAAV